MSRIIVHDDAVRAQLGGMRRRAERLGVDALARSIADRLQENTNQAFAQKVDPGSGRPWNPEASATGRSRLFKSLLVRSGQLLASTRSSVLKGATGSAFARMSLDTSDRSVLVRGLVHHYGIKARARRSNRASRKNPKFFLPARSFTGLSRSDIAEFMREAEDMIVGR